VHLRVLALPALTWGEDGRDYHQEGSWPHYERFPLPEPDCLSFLAHPTLCRSLTALSIGISYCMLEEPSLRPLAALHNLEALHLSCYYLDDARCVDELCEAVCSLAPHLRELYLHRSSIDAVAGLPSTYPLKLEHLDRIAACFTPRMRAFGLWMSKDTDLNLLLTCLERHPQLRASLRDLLCISPARMLTEEQLVHLLDAEYLPLLHRLYLTPVYDKVRAMYLHPLSGLSAHLQNEPRVVVVSPGAEYKVASLFRAHW